MKTTVDDETIKTYATILLLILSWRNRDSSTASEKVFYSEAFIFYDFVGIGYKGKDF